MMNILIDILPLMFIIAFLIGFKVESLNGINEDYLSIETTKCYKGLFSIMVVFHHLAQCVQKGILLRHFTFIGYLAVAVFFFYSGYGLQKSYIQKKEKYCKGFLLKKFLLIFVPYIIFTFFYWFLNYICGNFYSLKDVIFLLVSGDPLVSYSWFVITIFVFYLAYWLLMMIYGNNYINIILSFLFLYIIYIIFCIKLGFGSWWYNTCHLFLIGLIWPFIEQRIIIVVKKNWWIICFTWILFFSFVFFKRIILEYSVFKYYDLFFDLIISFVFTFCVLLFSMKVKFENRIFSFLGNFSLEIYLFHGFFMQLFRSNLFYVLNDFVWALLVLLFTIIFSYVFNILFKKLLGIIKDVFRCVE